MKTYIVLSTLLNFAYLATAQSSTKTSTAAAAKTSNAFPLSTENPTQIQGGDPGDANSSSGNGVDSAAGASGSDTGSFGQLSHAGLIAIIVVVSCVVVFGIVSAVLFYLAKKRSWEVRASIRKSARRVATALTPRRSEFPKNVRDGGRTSRGRTRIDDVPPTPRMTSFDLEKANSKLTSFELKQAPKGSAKWAKRTDR